MFFCINIGECMSNKEYEEERKERDKENKKSSIIVFTTVILSLFTAILYIVING